jgi:small nuclear ribonucleoprotein (snRNP)-like protein
MSESAQNFLKTIQNNKCRVKLVSGEVEEGVFLSMDGSLNVVLEQENKEGEKKRVFYRGNNVQYVAKI